jgi:hypothetical protein
MASNSDIQKEIAQIKKDIEKMRAASKNGNFDWSPFGGFEIIFQSPSWNPLSENPPEKRKKKK